ncbi:putative receptor-like protein kinase [Nymphaea thermarum]|nr:putative receptor-like protein kinase [Nymphaea thermarum]
MIGMKKKIGPTDGASSEAYFPQWIHTTLSNNQKFEGIAEGRADIVRKIATIALWCIQWNPINRPCMKEVVRMLESSTASLTMPPNHFYPVVDQPSCLAAVGSLLTACLLFFVTRSLWISPGSRRALVYDFMENGSLEKFTDTTVAGCCLLRERLYDIALGTARGIEYLHQGCDRRIIHFDIKPHNILLDGDFTPKISDFGLAKSFCKEKNSVTITEGKGTIGYIAPELFYGNSKHVSHKTDVYSFGMLLMAVIGMKEKFGPTDGASSEEYFPQWIHATLSKNQKFEGIGEGQDEIVRKIATIALWCIQWNPIDRPCMKEVVMMLESSASSLTMPPIHFYPVVEPDIQVFDSSSTSDCSGLTPLKMDLMDSRGLCSTYHNAISHRPCPAPRHNVSFDSKYTFELDPVNTNYTFLIDCPKSPSSSSNNFPSPTSSQFVLPPINCLDLAVVVPFSGARSIPNNGSFPVVVKNWFILEWSQAAFCSVCEATKGACGRKTATGQAPWLLGLRRILVNNIISVNPSLLAFASTPTH